jgi:hypothetical protein
MRHASRLAVPVLLLAAFAAGAAFDVVSGRALAEDPVDPIAALQRDVKYLKSREAQVSAYVLKNGARAEELDRLVNELRDMGFAAAANPTPARERLLRGLSDFAAGLRKDLPKLTDEEAALGGPVR